MIKFLYQLIKRQAKRENLFSINVNVCRCCVFGQQLLINIQDLWWIHSANMQEISNKIHCEITEKKPRPTLLMVENMLWNSSCLISRRLRCIVTLFVEMVSHKIIFFLFQRQLSAKRVKKVLERSSQTQNYASQPLIY